MTICPKDGKQCYDDVCSGTGYCASSRGNMGTIEICRQFEEFCECYDEEWEDDYCPKCEGLGEGPCVCEMSP